MKMYHVTEGTRQELMSFNDSPKLNYLTTAWAYYRDARVRKNLSIIRENADSLIIDSGFLGAAKKGDLGWQDNQQYVIDVASEAMADVCVMVDIPMEPHILDNVDLSRREALEITLRNAELFMDAKLPDDIIKMFVVQGWYIEDYEWCFEQLEQMGCISEKHWLGIGSVCMRKPCRPGRENYPAYQLYDVCRRVCELVNHRMHIHCFGIANPQWMWYLEKTGINSCDSATAVIAASFREKISKTGQRTYFLRDSTVETRSVLLRENKIMLTNLANQCDWQLPLF